MKTKSHYNIDDQVNQIEEARNVEASVGAYGFGGDDISGGLEFSFILMVFCGNVMLKGNINI